MATSDSIKAVSRVAGSALTLYRFVSLAADGKYDHTGAAARIDGIVGEGVPADGDVFPMVVPDGTIALVEAGAAVTINVLVQSDATGRAIDHVSGVGVGRGGVALEAAGAAGEIIRVQFLVSEDQVA